MLSRKMLSIFLSLSEWFIVEMLNVVKYCLRSPPFISCFTLLLVSILLLTYSLPLEGDPGGFFLCCKTGV